MYLKDLDKRKIDRKFVLTPAAFFNSFFGNYNNHCKDRFSPQELFFLLSDCLHNCSNSQVKLDNVLTGKIILVGFDKGLVKAYYRPVINYNEVENVDIEVENDLDNPESSINIYELSLSELINQLPSYTSDNDKYGSIYNEIILRSGIEEDTLPKRLTKKY